MMKSYQKTRKAFRIRFRTEKILILNALPVYHDRYIKSKIRTYPNKFYTNFRDLNAPIDDIECESFTIITIDSSLVYKNKHELLEFCQIILMKMYLKLIKIRKGYLTLFSIKKKLI